MKDVKWLFFDVGYTLVNEDEVWLHRIKKQLGMNKLSGSPDVSGDELFQALKDATAVYQPDYRSLCKRYGFTEFALFDGSYEKPYEEAAMVLSALKERYHLGILANQSPELSERLKKYDLFSFFDLIISSADVGLEKPDPEIFKLALREAGCAPHEAVMIGDRLDNDILPAKREGMRTVRIRQGTTEGQKARCEEEVPDHEVMSLLELLKLFS